MQKILITGSSGFVGRIITPILKTKYNIKTLGINTKNDYSFNLCNEIPIFKNNFDVVLHAAGKAHMIPQNKKESKKFFQVNLEGTKNLCKSLQTNPPKSFIYISTVAVYGVQGGTNIDETHPLNGVTPYALSKIEAENYLNIWCNQNNINLTILRPSLIAGPNPPGNLGTMIKGIKNGLYLRIGKGNAKKSILMAKDIAKLLPNLINRNGIYNICDNHHPSFVELEKLISFQLKKANPFSIPLWLAKIISKGGDLLGKNAPINTNRLKKITQTLTFSNEKAKKELNWEPLDVLQNFKIY